MTRLILASTSASRRTMLDNAGVPFEAEPAGVDEDTVKASLAAEKAGGAHVAEVLAELKAIRVSARRPGALVLGADQVLDLSGRQFDKPRSLAEAGDHLRALSGQWHKLACAAVIAENGSPVWRFVAAPKLKMRALSEAFIADYLAAEGEGVLSTVGAYVFEGRGAQLFEAVEGDFFSVLGLPLLPLLAYLRTRGVLAS